MLKKLSILAACAALAVGSMLAATPAQAQVPSGIYLVSYCTSQSQVDCPFGPNPIFVGPFTDYTQCANAYPVFAAGFLNMPPRSLSWCITF